MLLVLFEPAESELDQQPARPSISPSGLCDGARTFLLHVPKRPKPAFVCDLHQRQRGTGQKSRPANIKDGATAGPPAHLHLTNSTSTCLNLQASPYLVFKQPSPHRQSTHVGLASSYLVPSRQQRLLLYSPHPSNLDPSPQGRNFNKLDREHTIRGSTLCRVCWTRRSTAFMPTR